MFEEFLQKTYYGNTVLDWLLALAIIVGALVVGKALYWVFGNIVKRFTKKTKTRLDDIVIDMIEEPIVFIVTIAGIWYGLNRLELHETVEQWLGNIIQFLIILTIAWLITRLLDSFYKEYVVPLVSKTETDLDDQLLPILQKGTRLTVWSVGVISETPR